MPIHTCPPFKNINNNYGHQVGDHALIFFSTELQDAFSRFVVARAGGGEFIASAFPIRKESSSIKRWNRIMVASLERINSPTGLITTAG